MNIVSWHVKPHLNNLLPWRLLDNPSTGENTFSRQPWWDSMHRTFKQFEGRWHFEGKTEPWLVGKHNRTVGVDTLDNNDFNVFVFHLPEGNFRPWWMAPNDQVPVKNLPNETLEWLRANPSVHIVFNDYWEASHTYPSQIVFTAEDVNAVLEELDITNPVVWISGGYNADKVYPAAPNWRVLGSDSWLQLTYNPHFLQWAEYPELLDPTEMLDVDSFRARALTYVGRARPSRLYLLDSLYNARALDNVWVKYNALNAHNIKIHIDERARCFVLTNEVCSALEQKYQGTIDTFPDDVKEHVFYIDNMAWNQAQKAHYKNVFADIVMETYNIRNGNKGRIGFLTEKTIKPIHACRAFITSANPGYYAHLHELGFKTFDRWWDESFDEERDFEKHVAKYTDTVRYISSWSDEYTLQVFKDMRSTLEHNRAVLDAYSADTETPWEKSLKKMKKS